MHVSIGMCSSSRSAALALGERELSEALSIVVSRFDLPRSLHPANAPTCSWGLLGAILLLPVDAGRLTNGHILLHH